MGLQSIKDLPESLVRIVEWTFHAKVINRYLQIVDVQKTENYDEKGYKVTQSELLSGGIPQD